MKKKEMLVVLSVLFTFTFECQAGVKEILANGKSFLERNAELDLSTEQNRSLRVIVDFGLPLITESGDPNQFLTQINELGVNAEYDLRNESITFQYNANTPNFLGLMRLIGFNEFSFSSDKIRVRQDRTLRYGLKVYGVWSRSVVNNLSRTGSMKLMYVRDALGLNGKYIFSGFYGSEVFNDGITINDNNWCLGE